MKKRILNVIGILLIASVPLFAKEKHKGSDEQKIRLERTTNHHRPLSLGDESFCDINVNACWKEGVLRIIFSEPEGPAIVDCVGMCAGTFSRVHVNTSAPIYINIGYPDEPLRIVITTSVGNEYEGYLIVN